MGDAGRHMGLIGGRMNGRAGGRFGGRMGSVMEKRVAKPDPGGWQPTDIAGCQLWLKADAGITKDGSNYVSQWADQSGNNNHAVQATGSAQPLWVDGELNGLPSIYFDSINFLYLSNLIALNSFTVFLIHKWVSTYGYIAYSIGDGKLGFFNNTPNIYGGSYGIFDGTNELSSNDAHISGYCLFEYFNTKLYRNSIASVSYLYNQNITNQILILYIGGGAWKSVGYTTEVILYNSELSDTNRQLIENYLNTKYALW